MEAFEKIQANSDPFVVGVVSDTHIPDRVGELHPFLLAELRAHSVQLILHGGDISVRKVLTELATVAPVRAVAGNRDWLLCNELPLARGLEIYGTRVVLTHGHMGAAVYWKDKVQHITRGYLFERYQKRLGRAFPQARIILFGHTHHIENRWIGETLYFNPGSVSHGDAKIPATYFGLLKFYEDGRIEPSLIPLSGAVIRNKKWEITR
jgi:putative phosphoesterase